MLPAPSPNVMNFDIRAFRIDNAAMAGRVSQQKQAVADAFFYNMPAKMFSGPAALFHAIAVPDAGLPGERRNNGRSFHRFGMADQFNVALDRGAYFRGGNIFNQPRTPNGAKREEPAGDNGNRPKGDIPPELVVPGGNDPLFKLFQPGFQFIRVYSRLTGILIQTTTSN